ncbi:MAG TPA: molybdopterin cofactor-binding domain-containing protein [Vicinamibacterales bacterium]|nr:molybdopterin cofactor-binding domain-containing protein [Vicinamibacterales bacterium]
MTKDEMPAIEAERYEFDEASRYRFELERRDFIRLFGAGLLVVVAAPEIAAQQQGESGRRGGREEASNELAAWLHIGEDGRVTACTGKVEIGQNARTSLTQTVADELRVPVASVAFVMGDTDRTPYDRGTFGSRTTPTMAPQMARAAATAREMLIDRAAQTWSVDRASLTAKDGRIAAPGGRTIGYGELTKGQTLTGMVAADAAVEKAGAWQARGKPQKKVDGRAFVTGAHEYPADIKRPGLVYGRIVRPEAYGATLVSVDDARAKAIAGVQVVRDGDFLGVVAPTERDAKRAASLVRATWKVPAGQPSSDTIYDYLKKNEESGGRGSDPQRVGDVERARRDAAKTFEASYRIPYIAHVPLEPRAAVAEWQDGKLTVWTGTQRPFGVKAELVEAFHLPEDRVRVIMPDMGAGFGGKHTGECAIEAARLAKAAGKPVKIVYTRAEEFSWAYLRPAGVIDVRSALDAGGRIVAWEFHNWNSGGSGIDTPYDVPNQLIQFHPTKTPLRQGSYRGLAATANHYVREMQMDLMARAIGADAVEFRLKHLTNDRVRNILQAVAKKAGWPKPSAAGRALGIACGTEKGGYVATAAELSKTADGFRVERVVVGFECGAIVNPDGLNNQVEGAVVQGLGGALFEHIEFADGRILNGTMEQYRVPRFKDMPKIEVVLLDRKDLPSAGAGETPLVCVAPAIGSAARAFGKVAEELPVRFA